MKNLRAAVLLFALPILLALSTLAQVSPDEGIRGPVTLADASLAGETIAADSADSADSIATARCRYAVSGVCGGSSESDHSNQANGDAQANKTFSQISRPTGLPPRPMAYPGGYRPRGMGSGRRLAIGAAIGLGIGAAIGVKVGEHQSSGVKVKTSALFGVFGAAIGAGIASVPSPRYRSPRRYRSRPRRRRRFADEGEMADVSKTVATP